MGRRPPLSRRTLLVAGLALAGGGAGGIVTILARGRKRRALTRGALLDLARSLDLDEAARGAVIAAIGPALEERSIDGLADAILADEALPASALPARLARQVESDFATGDTLLAAGWILSRTEARFLLLGAQLDRT